MDSLVLSIHRSLFLAGGSPVSSIPSLNPMDAMLVAVIDAMVDAISSWTCTDAGPRAPCLSKTIKFDYIEFILYLHFCEKNNLP